jgi:hypothetical protein
MVAAMLVVAATTANAGGKSCCNRFDFVFKKTIFRIDVFRLRLVFDKDTVSDVEKIVLGRKRTRDLEDAVAARYLEAPFAEVTVEPRRSISHEQFIKGFSKTQMVIANFGLFDAPTGMAMVDDTASRYAFLKERGMKKGDRLHFTLRGDSLFCTYTRADGTVELDDIRNGPEARHSLLGGYFVPKADFRDGVMDQLFECAEQSSE